MRKFTALMIIVTTTVLLSFTVQVSAKPKPKLKPARVTLGMPMTEVENILGSPKFYTIDGGDEIWEYVDISTWGLANDHHIKVIFDNNKNVKSFVDEPYQRSVMRDKANYRKLDYSEELNPDDIILICDKLKQSNFDDNRMDILEVANLRCRYTCRQASQILKTFSFSQGRMKALRSIAPLLLDPSHASDIYESLSFASEKEEAEKILRVAH